MKTITINLKWEIKLRQDLQGFVIRNDKQQVIGSIVWDKGPKKWLTALLSEETFVSETREEGVGYVRGYEVLHRRLYPTCYNSLSDLRSGT